MADYCKQKCIFRSEKKEFFEALKKEQKLIGNDLYKYLYENSRELFDEYEVENSRYDDESDSKLIIKEVNGKIEAEIYFTYVSEPSLNAVDCLVETISRKAGITSQNVQIITYYWWSDDQFLITNDPLLKDKVLITNLVGYADTDFWNKLKTNLENSPCIIVDETSFYEPSVFLDKIKQTIKDENLKGYEDLGKDYEFNNDDSTNKIYDWNDFNDKEPSDDILAILDFADRYEVQNGENSIYPYFLNYYNPLSPISNYFTFGVNNYIFEKKEKAEEYFNRAANNGFSKGRIGCFYEEQEEDEKAVYWFKRSIQEDTDKYTADSSYWLGVYYYRGIVCEEDKEKAKQLFEQAAKCGYRKDYIGSFFFNIYINYDYKSYNEAFYWYKRFIDELDEHNDYDDEEIADATYKLRYSALLLGLYEDSDGFDTGVDKEEAFYYLKYFFENVTDLDDYDEYMVEGAAYRLGKLYYEGKVCKQDKEKAEEYFKICADRGSCPSVIMDFYGNETDDEEKTFYWAERAVEEEEDDVAYFFLGTFYYEGKVCKQDKEKAEEYFNNYYPILVGDYYRHAGDYEMAIKWYSRAVDEGDDEAKEKLEELKKKIN